MCSTDNSASRPNIALTKPFVQSSNEDKMEFVFQLKTSAAIFIYLFQNIVYQIYIRNYKYDAVYVNIYTMRPLINSQLSQVTLFMVLPSSGSN